jgi:5-methylthioadenosine/S-adenosylhomocysteine deaminase
MYSNKSLHQRIGEFFMSQTTDKGTASVSSEGRAAKQSDRPLYLVLAPWIIPVEPAGVVLEGHGLAFQNGRILAIEPAEILLKRFPDALRIERPDHVLMPGLVNLHCHAAMALLRGIADDLPLMAWLNDHIWPKEGAHVDPEFVYDGSRLAFAEALMSGTTTVNDMYFFPDAGGRAALALGLRVALGINVIEFPTRYAHDADEYIRKGLAARSQFLGEALISTTLAPHAPYTISDHTWRRMVTLADELDAPIHTHIHETVDEITGSLKEHRVRPLERLANLGVVSPRLISVHSVHYNASEIDYCARHGVHIAHCPASNLKLASGIAPIKAMLDAGLNVGIGTDGAASNNRLDMFAEMRLAALLAKGASGDATALSAHQAIRAATLNGARALALEHKIGSLEPGKDADMVALRLDTLATQPVFDAASHVVYAAGREHVTDVWVAGEQCVAGGELTRGDTQELRARVRYWGERLA